jgi:hypothetical protein
MFKIYKRVGRTFDLGKQEIGEAETFEEALMLGMTVCKDNYHQGGEIRNYWFSDESDYEVPYKIVITNLDNPTAEYESDPSYIAFKY